MKWIIVTGDSKGVGQKIVSKILQETDYGVIGISRSGSLLNKKFVSQFSDRYHSLEYDLSNVEDVKKLYLDNIKKIGPIHGLVNNAAIAYDDIISNLNIKHLTNMFNINVFAAMHLTKYVIRDMLLRKTKGSIVHISSISAHTGYKGLSMYAASKGALESFSKNIAREWGSRGIRSNCVVPGFMETSMSESLTEEQKDRIYKRTSLKRETDIESVANTVLFLLSEKSNSITGSVIHVDNGTI